MHLTIGDLWVANVEKLGIHTAPYATIALRSVVMVGASFAVSLFTRKFLELPMLRLKRYFEYAKSPAS